MLTKRVPCSPQLSQLLLVSVQACGAMCIEVAFEAGTRLAHMCWLRQGTLQLHIMGGPAPRMDIVAKPRAALCFASQARAPNTNSHECKP